MTKKKNYKVLPDVYAVPDCELIGLEYGKVNPGELLKDIPTAVVMHHLAEWCQKIIYAPMRRANQIDIWNEFCAYIPKKKRDAMIGFIRKFKMRWALQTPDTLSFLCQLALLNFVSLDGDNDLELTEEETNQMFDAILFCNSCWLRLQVKDFDKYPSLRNDAVGLSLKTDIPIMEFKRHKDFKTQLFKAFHFFYFMENHPHYSSYLPYFCKDYRVNDWRDYILELFNFMDVSLRSPYVNVEKSVTSASVRNFLNQFVIDVNHPDLKKWNPDVLMPRYLREHFLVPIGSEIYLLLNPNLLVDRMFQGLKFLLYDTVKKHGLKSEKGKEIKSQADFNSMLGIPFAEKTLLKNVMEMTFQNASYVHLTEDDFDKVGRKDSAPDYYMRQGKTLWLMECKDLVLGDGVKMMEDPEELKKELLKRVCVYEEEKPGKFKRKGFGQLLWSVKELMEGNKGDGLDDGIGETKEIWPIVVTTDTAFSANGVNALVLKEFVRIVEKYGTGGKVFLRTPVIIDIDTLIHLSWRIKEGTLDLRNLLLEYMDSKTYPIASFSSYVYDNYIKGYKMTPEENKHLFPFLQ